MSEKQTNSYTVVARRYRPQAFVDLVGQPHVITALSNAIEQHRVGHAYLFTGARGVGKTSTARIFAKCLNCLEGPTIAPCNACDVCEAVSVGEDIDVIEIDGASNRGIDEIRQLRSNANIRPSRCRFKIYIIDEVHMLTAPAFNALLKTLEEPPEHVKFIFCTTDPHKIPITVLSRCQRFDFAPVEANEITVRLREIAEKEGVSADQQALEIIARRANGSMRDSQSLFEQLLSFCDKKIEVADVYRLLGTADIGRIHQLVSAMVNRNMPTTMNEIDAALKTGVDVGQLAQQMVGYLRDMMAAKAGCDANLMLNVMGADFSQLQLLTQDVGMETIFSMLQIVDQAVTRMQHSHHSRVLLESAALRCCELENLQSISDLLAGLNGGGTVAHSPRPVPVTPTPAPSAPQAARPAESAIPPDSKKKENDLAVAPRPESVACSNFSRSETDAVSGERQPSKADRVVSEGNADFPLDELWKRTLAEVGEMTADFATDYQRIVMSGPNQVKITLAQAYSVQMCNRPERRQKFEEVLGSLMGRNMAILFEAGTTRVDMAEKVPQLSRRERIRNVEKHPFVRTALDTFSADVTDISEGRRPAPTNPTS